MSSPFKMNSPLKNLNRWFKEEWKTPSGESDYSKGEKGITQWAYHTQNSCNQEKGPPMRSLFLIYICKHISVQ